MAVTNPHAKCRKHTPSTPRPKACLSLDAHTVETLRSRVTASSTRTTARELAVSDACVRRVLAGASITPALHRLLTMQLAPRNPAASAA